MRLISPRDVARTALFALAFFAHGVMLRYGAAPALAANATAVVLAIILFRKEDMHVLHGSLGDITHGVVRVRSRWTWLYLGLSFGFLAWAVHTARLQF